MASSNALIQIPDQDNRAKISPRQFVINLIFSLHAMDRGKRTLDALRRNLMKATGQEVSRGGFWERLATELSVQVCSFSRASSPFNKCRRLFYQEFNSNH